MPANFRGKNDLAAALRSHFRASENVSSRRNFAFA